MKRREITSMMKPYPVRTHTTLALMTSESPAYIARQVTEWSKKWWLIKLKRWVYVPAESMEWLDRLTISRWVVDPSYVSCESALSYYGMIPEGVTFTTCITPKKTQEYTTPVGIFSYKQLSPKFFRGWEQRDQMYIATPEKAFLDYLWLHPDTCHEQTIQSLRIHFPEEFSTHRFLAYMHRRDKAFFSKKLSLHIVPYLPYDWSAS